MRKKLILSSLIALASLGLSACSQTTHTPPAASQAAIARGQIIDLHSGETLTDRQLLVKLAGAQRLIVGEKHDNAEHHQIELWLMQNLARERPQGSVLLEMLTAGQQPRVTRVKSWLKEDPLVRDGRIQELLSWQKGWPWVMYGGVVTEALSAPYPLLNANINRDEIMRLYKEPRFPEGKLSTAPAVQAALKETIIAMHEGNIEGQQLTAMLAIQQQRDRYMAQQLLNAPAPALLIAGGYHASKSFGVPLHMEDLSPSSRPVVLMLAEKGMNVTEAQADYVWFVTPVAAKR